MTGGHVDINDLERLAALREGNSADSAQLRELEEHLRICTECAGMAEAYAKLRGGQIPDVSKTEIPHPSEEEWFAYAAGITPEGGRAALLSHVSACARCAALLNAVLQDFTDTAEDVELKQLQSSGAAWQHHMASRMVEVSGGSLRAPVIKMQPRGKWWQQMLTWKPLAVAAAVLLLATSAVVGTWFYRQGSEQALLSRASNERRLTELYLPGSAPRPIDSPTLGQQEADDVLPLLELKERARKHLDKDPNDAYWLQVEGRIALAEGNGSKAEKLLQLVQALNPALTGIKFDLAEAQFEMAAAEQNSSKYLRAADLFSQVIDDPAYIDLRSAAYYNRGLSWDRVSIYWNAAHDYENALKLEKDLAWQKLIQKRLADAKANAAKGEGRSSLELEASPEGFLKALAADRRRAEANYEIYFDYAGREWLQRGDAHAALALRELAKLGLAHHDAWLTDMLGSSTPAARAGTDDLAMALQANLEGDADLALRHLTAAGKSFTRVHNSAGMLRVRAEEIYSFQRMGRSDECLELAAAYPDRQLKRYAWLHTYQLLEVSICRAARGDTAEHLHNIQKCIELSRAAGFPNQALRARGMLVEILDVMGQPEAAQRAAATGLRDCNGEAGCSPMRVYQFEQSLTALLHESGLTWAAAGVAQAASHTSSLVLNLQIRAYAQEVLGQMETGAGHMASASSAFSRASALLSSMPDGNAAALYRADWETDRSALLARQGLLQPAVLKMRQAASRIAATDNFDVRQRFYTRLASLLLDEGHPEEARSVTLAAVSDAEHALASAANETEKLAWEKTYGSGYRLLVASLAAAGDARRSLEAWEWYRSAPYRPAAAIAGAGEVSFASVLLPSQEQMQQHTLILVIAQLDDRILVWCIPGSGDGDVRAARLAVTPERAAEMAQTFIELCSDRTSSEQNVTKLGSELYHELFAPFQQQIDAASQIALDVDAHLERIPFAALVRPDGRYLNETHGSYMLPAWWTRQTVSSGMISLHAHALLVEGTASLPASRGGPSTIPAEYFQTVEIAAHFSHPVVLRNADATVDQILRHISEAEIFHYNGHTLSTAEEKGLLLQGPDRLFTVANLQGVSMRQCRLAVLAACSSASGGTGGLEDTGNLSHALLTAGVANVVATLWDVDAQASKTMMLRMYDLLAQSAPLPEALRQAREVLRSSPSTSHPYFWSAVQVFTQ